MAGPWLAKIDCSTGLIEVSKIFRPCDPVGDALFLFKNWRSPHFWFALSTIAAFASAMNGIKTTRILRKLQTSLRIKESELLTLAGELEHERNDHADTKSEYLKDTERNMHSVFPLQEIGFDATCRISVYRKVPSKPEILKQIFRYAIQPRFNSKGRIRIPSNEGVVGVVWNALPHSCFTCDFPSGKPKHKRDFNAFYKLQVPDYQAKPAANGLRMPSKSIFAFRLGIPHQPNSCAAVLVIESTEKNKFDETTICAILEERRVEIERITSIVSHLDSEFRPDGEV